MLGFILKRILAAIPTVFLASVLVFLLIRMIPGDPAEVMLGEAATPGTVAALRTQLGLDQPLPVQFGLWLGSVVRGELGTSILLQQPVGWLIWDRFKLTALIIVLAVGIATILAVSAGLYAAWRQNTFADFTIVALATLGLSLPSFWIGLLLLMVLGLGLGWLPVVGYVSFAEDPSQAWKFIIMPVLTLVIIEFGVLTRMARSSAIDVLRLEYITHARAKGLSERRVLLRHALPNAFAPTLTMVGVIAGSLLGGSAVVETVFTLPGLGRLLVEAIYGRDYPVIQGCLLVIAMSYVVVNLVTDLLYPVFDPRVTME